MSHSWGFTWFAFATALGCYTPRGALQAPSIIAVSFVKLPPRAVVAGLWAPSFSGEHLFTCRLETFLDSCAVQPSRASGGMGNESLFPDEAKVTKGMVDAARWLRRPRVLMGHTVGSKQQGRLGGSGQC